MRKPAFYQKWITQGVPDRALLVVWDTTGERVSETALAHATGVPYELKDCINLGSVPLDSWTFKAMWDKCAEPIK